MRKAQRNTCTRAVLVIVLTACGSPDADKEALREGGPPGTRSASASAAQVAAEMRGRVQCPAQIATSAKPASDPVDDVLGVHPGMTYEEAANKILCLNPLLVVEPDKHGGFEIDTYGQTVRQGFSAHFAEARVEKTGQQIMQEMRDEASARGSNRVTYDMQPGQSKFYVGTMGMPGQERVISVAREEWFEEGRNPTIASVRTALINKYGMPSLQDTSFGGHSLHWIYDPTGALVSHSSPLLDRCRGVADPRAGASISEGCGLVIAAYIEPTKENADLAKLVRAGSIDHARAFVAIADTERDLALIDAQRRAREVDQASKSAGAVRF